MRLGDLAALLARSQGRRGTGRLRPFVERADAPTRSVFEDAFVVSSNATGCRGPSSTSSSPATRSTSCGASRA
jgi:hypothetical protein